MQRAPDSTKLMESLDDGMRKIETMWDNFSLNDSNLRSMDFNEKFERKIKKPTTRKKQALQVEWVPRVTIPQPFSMTIREQIKCDRRQENVMHEMREEREKRIEAEIRECKRKFKARPVPKHVTLPLYEQKLRQDEMRKQKLRQMNREYTEKAAMLVDARTNCLSKSVSATDLTKKEVAFFREFLEFYLNIIYYEDGPKCF